MNEFELVKKQNDVCDFNRQSQKRGAEFQLDCHDSTMDVMEEYTKCCVCLEPYECGGDDASTEKRRLPIKSATCAHSLCEECLDGYHASLVADKSNLRYVRCPQCNDKTKKAFDIQNKVIDFFLREYIMSRSALASKRRVKAKTAPVSRNECDNDMPAPNLSISSVAMSTERRKMIEKAAAVWAITS